MRWFCLRQPFADSGKKEDHLIQVSTINDTPVQFVSLVADSIANHHQPPLTLCIFFSG
jgi:hypothetical protein